MYIKRNFISAVMPSPVAHYGLGLLIAWVLGYRRKEGMKLAVLATIPDLDVATTVLFELASYFMTMSHDAYISWGYFAFHREFFHSIFFIILISGIIYAWTRDWKYTGAAALMQLSHISLDYITTWGLRAFFPISMERVSLNGVGFFDAVFNIITALVVVAYIIYQVSHTKWFKSKYRDLDLRMPRFRCIFERSHKFVLVFIIVYLVAMVGFKEACLYNRSDWDKVESDQAIPNGFYKYVYCVDKNDTVYKVVNMDVLAGSDEYLFLKKSDVICNDNMSWSNFSFTQTQLEARVKGLVENEGTQVIKYFTFRINLTKDGAKVRVFDARRELVGSTIPQNEGYVFVFKTGLSEFKAYYDSEYMGENSVLNAQIPSYRFE